MSETIYSTLQQRKLTLRSFSRYWTNRQYVEALSCILDIHDEASMMTVGELILSIPEEIKEEVFQWQ